jgi:RES domain-containing protein/HEPN superfamily RES-like protein
MKKKQTEVPVEEKLLCGGCVGEEFLKGEMKNGDLAACSYCGKRRKTVSIKDIADDFEGAFERHFYKTSTEPNDYEYMLLKDRESAYEFERHGEPVLDVIQKIGEVSEEIAEDILEVLEERYSDYEAEKMGEESEFDSESNYAERKTSIAELYSQWRQFQTSLQTESRYFNNTAETFLDDVFRELGQDGTTDGREVIVDAGPDTSILVLYRARVFQNETTFEEALKRPDRDLAAPPFRVAKAGRMNAHGISLFYGATDRSVAVAEVRPPVGSRVMTGEFRLLRPLKLLDLEALLSLEVNGSFFDPRYLSSLQRADFLGFLSQEMAKPVMPDDEQFSYLPTQVIADYLANGRIHLDGIIYPSVQGKDGLRNIVLFHEAAKVKDFVIPPHTELSANATLDPDHDTSYWVFETTDGSKAKKAGKSKMPRTPSRFDEQDYRDLTLELNHETVQVHYVRGITFDCELFEVHRHASTQSGPSKF